MISMLHPLWRFCLGTFDLAEFHGTAMAIAMIRRQSSADSSRNADLIDVDLLT
jgi:hypothetical protein